jgi:prolyl oligopeptidase
MNILRIQGTAMQVFDHESPGNWVTVTHRIPFRADRLVPWFLLLCWAGWMSPVAGQRYHYPPARQADVVEDYHGTLVSDPYRWMEDPDDPEVLDWVAAQNRLTREYIDGPTRERIEQRLTKLWNYPRYSLPYRKGERYFFWKNDGLQNQSVLYVQEGLEGEPRVLLDPNRLSPDGTIAVAGISISQDGSLLAYRLSESGSDWQTIHIREVNSGLDYPEVLQWCRFAGIAWKPDNSGFYYDRYPEPGVVPEAERKYHNRVFWHQLGTPQAEDRLVYERPDNKELGFAPIVTDDGQYLILHVWHGTDEQNRIYYRPVASDGSFVRLLDEADAGYYFIDNDGPVFYFQTDLEAPRGRIIAIDTDRPDRDRWREIVPQTERVLAFVTMVNDQFVTAYLEDAHHRLFVYDRNGRPVREIDLPTIGSIAGLSGRREDPFMFFGFQSFLYPRTIFRYDLVTGERSLFHAPEIDFDPDRYETRQVFVTSKDGTRVPMFLTHRKNLELNGENPTLLYGYGGFKISLTPSFSIPRLVWLEQGGVFALANLRGGGEYGEEWHRAGMLANKQNVFDDFIAAAEWLIAAGYTQTSRLAILGRSNGGLLVAACMVQRPDLFGAVVCGVPVIDMLRYHRFTIGKYWAGEYGNAEENPDHFRFLYAYSPLHNVQPGTTYPPTLVTTADTDDRVVPAHAKKFVATLQAADTGENPILLRVETKAGHGHGKPTTKVIQEWSDIYGFLFRTFDLAME